MATGVNNPYTLPKSFTSADQTITSAGTLTLAHGLGTVPTHVLGFLVCQTAENGYSIGDIISVPFHDYGSGNGIGFTPTMDGTNVYIQFGNSAGVFYVAKRSATIGISAALTNGNWKLRVRAWQL